MNKPAEKDALKAAAVPEPKPDAEKARLRREEDQQDALLESIPRDEAGLLVPEILAGAAGISLNEQDAEVALYALVADGRLSMVLRDEGRTLAYRRTT